MTDESTERKAPCVEVVTLNYILSGTIVSYCLKNTTVGEGENIVISSEKDQLRIN